MTTIDTDPDTGLAPLEFAVTRNLAAKSTAQRDEILASPGFGQSFTDHMVDICWSVRGGWHRPRVSPYGPISRKGSSTRRIGRPDRDASPVKVAAKS